jgi:hypothetical protein
MFGLNAKAETMAMHSPIPPPLIEQHVMEKVNTRYTPTFTLQIENCDVCWVVYSETFVFTDGETKFVPGIRSPYDTFGFWRAENGSFKTNFVSVADDVQKICLGDFQICRSYDPKECISLDSDFYYQWDPISGKVKETFPQKTEGLINNDDQASICETPTS